MASPADARLRGDEPGNGLPPRWRVAGLVATAAIVLSVPLYLLAHRSPPARAQPPGPAGFVGSERCRPCHQKQHEAWKGSHHARAMQPARDDTVLGDFSGARLLHRGKEWRFFRRDGEFVVRAEGPGGAMQDYAVAYTFGVEPLQQYLVRFPGGRLQALSAAWDTKARRWFYVYPGPEAPPGDWLHWT